MISPRKILAIKLRSLGDTILMTAALRELRYAFPAAQLHVVVLEQWAPLLYRFPGVSKIWTYVRHNEAAARAKAVARLAVKLRREHYDCVVNFHASPSSSALAFATGARVRSIHFHGHKDKNRFSTVEVPGKGQLFPVIERDMNAIRALDLDVPPGKLPKIFLEHRELDEGLDWLEGRGMSGSLMTIGIGASRPTKSWQVDRYAQIASEWCEKTGGCALAVASPDERAACDAFLNAVKPGLNIGAETSLSIRKLAGVLHHSAVMVGNDSGPRHLAVAVGTPTVTLFGPEHPFEWHPYPANLHPHFFVEGLACRKDADPGKPPWCGLHDCLVERHQCMDRIGTEQVLSECLKVARI